MPPEVQQVLDEISAWQVLIWAVIVTGALVGLRKAWPTITDWVNTLNALGALPAHIEHTNTQLAAIKHEVLPNQGGSLRDETDRQGRQLTEVLGTLDGVRDKLAKDNDRIGQLEQLAEDQKTLFAEHLEWSKQQVEALTRTSKE